MTPEMLIEKMAQARFNGNGMEDALRVVLQAIEDGEVVEVGCGFILESHSVEMSV